MVRPNDTRRIAVIDLFKFSDMSLSKSVSKYEAVGVCFGGAVFMEDDFEVHAF